MRRNEMKEEHYRDRDKMSMRQERQDKTTGKERLEEKYKMRRDEEKRR